MTGRCRCARLLAAGLGVALLPLTMADSVVVAAAEKARPALHDRPRDGGPGADPAVCTMRPDRAKDRGQVPRTFLIHLVHGGDPIIVACYFQEGGEIVFEKYGGWIRIPVSEVLEIRSDEPDRTANFPPPPPTPALTDTAGARVPLRPEPTLYLMMQGGGNLKVAGLTPEGERARITVLEGSFTVPRSQILGVVRVPRAGQTPEAWLSIEARNEATNHGTVSTGTGRPAGLAPATPDPRLPYQQAAHPHLLHLATGQVVRVDAFWVEDGAFRFERLGGVVGLALSEILRVLPDETAPVRGRTPVRFARRLERDLLEVSVRSGSQRVRLAGVAPAGTAPTEGDGPWRHLERGMTVHLEFDRQRYDADGAWLAYVFLPNGRMLNAELIRAGMARPVSDSRNVRYLDLLFEMAGGPPAAGDRGPK